jgi:hypothetical protein
MNNKKGNSIGYLICYRQSLTRRHVKQCSNTKSDGIERTKEDSCHGIETWVRNGETEKITWGQPSTPRAIKLRRYAIVCGKRRQKNTKHGKRLDRRTAKGVGPLLSQLIDKTSDKLRDPSQIQELDEVHQREETEMMNKANKSL